MIKHDSGYIYDKSSDMSMHEFTIYSITRGIKPYTILEIGIRSGVSTTAICCALQDEYSISEQKKVKYHCCDIDSSCRKVQKKVSIPLIFHVTSSDKLATTWKSPIDLLFIDGCHEYQQVKRDYFNFSKYVRKNGFIFLHDTCPPNERYKSPKFCWNAYKILDDISVDNSVEHITLPYSFGLTVCRKLK